MATYSLRDGRLVSDIVYVHGYPWFREDGMSPPVLFNSEYDGKNTWTAEINAEYDGQPEKLTVYGQSNGKSYPREWHCLKIFDDRDKLK